MERKTFPMERQKRIALMAHNTKSDLVQWAKDNKERLAHHELFATGSTGEELEDELGFDVHTLLHGPLGGDLQIGGKISEGRWRAEGGLVSAIGQEVRPGPAV
jgi:methylglyoxal synthase